MSGSPHARATAPPASRAARNAPDQFEGHPRLNEAEVLYQRALNACSWHTNNLGNYGLFLTDVRHAHSEAEALYRRALETDPFHARSAAPCECEESLHGEDSGCPCAEWAWFEDTLSRPVELWCCTE